VIIAFLVPITVVDHNPGDLVTLAGVALQPLLAGQFPWLGLIDYTVEFTGEGQFGHVRIVENYLPVPSAPYPGELLILESTGFIVGYDDDRNNPAWVSYRIFEMATLDSGQRPRRFKEDPRTLSKVTHEAYTRSGFDRGHMAPNYAIATRYGREAQFETFLMSNIVPQSPELNQGPWRKLEEMISGYAQKYDEVWVVTGPLYDDRPEYIGPEVEVPDGFFKIVVDETPSGLRVLAFNFPQDVQRRDNPARFLTTVDAIEELSGLDFFSELPDDVEERVEGVRGARLW
jgi:endonuclease G